MQGKRAISFCLKGKYGSPITLAAQEVINVIVLVGFIILVSLRTDLQESQSCLTVSLHLLLQHGMNSSERANGCNLVPPLVEK